MRATLLKETIKNLFPTKRTIAIEGRPGGGKTTIVQEVAKELGVGYIEKHMPTMLVEDFGILYPNGDDMLHYKLPDWFPYEGRMTYPMKVSCVSMTETKRVQTCRRCWLTSVKLGIYTASQ